MLEILVVKTTALWAHCEVLSKLLFLNSRLFISSLLKFGPKSSQILNNEGLFLTKPKRDIPNIMFWNFPEKVLEKFILSYCSNKPLGDKNSVI